MAIVESLIWESQRYFELTTQLTHLVRQATWHLKSCVDRIIAMLSITLLLELLPMSLWRANDLTSAKIVRRSEIWFSPSRYKSRRTKFRKAGQSKPLTLLINVYSVNQEIESVSMGQPKLNSTFGSETMTGKVWQKGKLRHRSFLWKIMIILTKSKQVRTMFSREMM